MNRKRFVLSIGAALLAVSATTAQEDGLDVVATTMQAFDLVTVLADGAEDVTVTGLMGPGVDPHLYQPTEADITAMNQADLVVFNGLDLEGRFDAVFEALRERGVAIYELGEPVKQAGFIIPALEEPGATEEVDDPHFWFDPRNWELLAADLAATLADLDPANAELFTANAEAYSEQLQTLFAWAEEGMTSVPEEHRHLVTSHDAFQYFGAAFGWRMEAVQGVSTEEEAGVGDIQATVDFIVENDIPVLFVESTVPPNTVQAVLEGVEAAGGTVRLGVRDLFSDAMGDAGTFAGTYIGMMAENVYTILQSFQCAGIEVTIPEWPETLELAPSEELLTVECEA